MIIYRFAFLFPFYFQEYLHIYKRFQSPIHLFSPNIKNMRHFFHGNQLTSLIIPLIYAPNFYSIYSNPLFSATLVLNFLPELNYSSISSDLLIYTLNLKLPNKKQNNNYRSNLRCQAQIQFILLCIHPILGLLKIDPKN